ncbi:MAG TPA: hypothetical protein VKA50_06605 [Gammaproteobacteria bacterium]|nr:hypothetical protein [Gammaproteobacteria bacterium]
MSLLNTLAAIEWHHPAAWSLAAVPPLLWLLAGLRRRRTLSYAEQTLRPWAVRDAGPTASWSTFGRAAVRLLGWILLAAALAGPRLPELHGGGPAGGPGDASRADVDLMVVLQVPFEPQDPVAEAYMQRVWTELQDLTARLHGERVGLVAYNGRAGVLATPTADRGALRFYLRHAPMVLAGWRGDALPGALVRARRTVANARSGGRSAGIVLIAAGGTLPDPAALAKALKGLREADVPVFALDMHALAADLLARHPRSRAFGVPALGPAAKRNIAPVGGVLREVARRTGGEYARLSDGDADWRHLYDDGAGELPSRPAVGSGELVRSWRPLYAWFLLPALLLLLLDAVGAGSGGWRGRATAAHMLWVVLCLGIGAAAVGWARPAAAAPVPPAAHPADPAYASAYRAYQAKDYALAQLRFAAVAGYAARLGEGASAYRRRDYAHAVRQFGAALLAAGNAGERATALFNLGNARFQRHEYARAVEAYEGALDYSRQAGGNQAARIRQNLWLARSHLAGKKIRRPAAEGGRPVRRSEPPEGFPDQTPPTVSATGTARRGEVARRIARGELSARPEQSGVEGGARDERPTDAADDTVLKLLDLVDDHTAALLRGVITHEPAPSAGPGDRP